MKIWLVRGTAGETEKAFRTKKQAIEYAERYLMEHHLSETDGVFNGVEGIELER